MGLLENTIGAMIGRTGGSDAPAASSGGSPYGALATALIGLLAAKAATGGFGNLGSVLGGGAGQQPAGQPGPGSQTSSSGGGLLSGLGGLLNQFQQSGHGNLINSWIGTGQNAPATPSQVTQALGPETVNELSQKTGMSAQDVAAQLSQELPNLIDRLTPKGRLPTHDEISNVR